MSGTMRIAGDQVIAELPAITARHLMRRQGDYITPRLVRQVIGCRPQRADAIVARLEAEGYIARVGFILGVVGEGLCALRSDGIKTSSTRHCHASDSTGIGTSL